MLNEQLLTHQVDVLQKSDPNVYGEDQSLYYARVPCLVDEASGRRRNITNNGVTQTFDFAVTFGPSAKSYNLKVGSYLEDARDADGVEIFSKASIEEVRTFRHPFRGITGYLVLANNKE